MVWCIKYHLCDQRALGYVSRVSPDPFIQPSSADYPVSTVEGLLRCCMIRPGHRANIMLKVADVLYLQKMVWLCRCYDTFVGIVNVLGNVRRTESVKNSAPVSLYRLRQKL